MSTKSIESVLIIVLNYGGFEDTKTALLSLTQQTYKKFSILVVNNSPGNDSTSINALVSEMTDTNTEAVHNTHNLGFAGGVNVGIERAIKKNIDAVFLLNNDATCEKDWLKNAVKTMNDTQASVVTGLLLNERGEKIDSSGEQYSIWGMPFPRSRNEQVSKSPVDGYTFGATGGASLYKTSLFKKIGLFDEKFFAYYEDVDVCFRAQLSGHSVYFTNSSVAYHKRGATSKKIPGFTVYQTFKNIPLLFFKNIPARLVIPVGIRLFFLYTLMFGKAIKNGTGAHAIKGWLASIGLFWTDSLWKRIAIQKRKTVPGSKIKELLWSDLPPEQNGMRKLRKIFTGKS